MAGLLSSGVEQLEKEINLRWRHPASFIDKLYFSYLYGISECHAFCFTMACFNHSVKIILLYSKLSKIILNLLDISLNRNTPLSEI
jgi:hypothetical protein